MTAIVMLGVFSICVLIGAPIGTAMCLSSVSALITSNMGLSMVPFNYYASISKFLLLAIPFFILAGNIMEKAGISTKLIKFAQSFVGHINGGLALVCACSMFLRCDFRIRSCNRSSSWGNHHSGYDFRRIYQRRRIRSYGNCRRNRNHYSPVDLLCCI